MNYERTFNLIEYEKVRIHIHIFLLLYIIYLFFIIFIMFCVIYS